MPSSPLGADRRRVARDALQAIHDRHRNVGAALSVGVRGRTVIEERLGYADLERRIPVRAGTLFGIASVTKSVTGLALLKLWEAGGIELDEPVGRRLRLPPFLAEAGEQITPRLLAAHLAGLRHWGDERTPALFATHFDDVADTLALLENEPFVAAPGTRYSYSSPGYNVLAAVIQAASGQRFQDYVGRAVLRPLGVPDLRFDDARLDVSRKARQYTYYDLETYAETGDVATVPERNYSHNMAGGNMVSTARDLVRLGSSVMRPGFLGGEAWERLTSREPVGGVESPVSFGWFVWHDDGSRLRLRSTGANPGVQAAVDVYPDAELVIVVLTNTWGVGASSGELVDEFPARIAEIVRS